MRDPTIHACPTCKYLPPVKDDEGNALSLHERLNYLDVGGACEGTVFCPQCISLFSWENGAAHECDLFCMAQDEFADMSRGQREREEEKCCDAKYGQESYFDVMYGQ